MSSARNWSHRTRARFFAALAPLLLGAGCAHDESRTDYTCEDRAEVALALDASATPATYQLIAVTEHGTYTCTVQMPRLEMQRDSYLHGDCSDPQAMQWVASFPSGGGRMCSADELGHTECITAEAAEVPLYKLVLFGTPQMVTVSAQRDGVPVLTAQRLSPLYQSEHDACTRAALTLALP